MPFSSEIQNGFLSVQESSSFPEQLYVCKICYTIIVNIFGYVELTNSSLFPFLLLY